MIQGRIPAVSFSVIAHAILLYAMSQTIVVKRPAQKTATTIDSYIYTPKPIKPIVTVEQLEKQAPPTPKPLANDNEQAVTIPQQKEQPTLTPELDQQAIFDSIKPPKKLLQQKAKTTSTNSVSLKALTQLSQLNKQQDKSFIEAQTAEQFRRRSPSVLDADPIPVPHSVKVQTRQAIKEKNTTRYTDELRIIKGDNGICTIEQDLSNVGIEGIKARSGFACGESKFDANFREHMKKVLKKLGK